MTDSEKNMDGIELSPEAMEEVAGGTGSTGEGAWVTITNATHVRQGPGKDYVAIATVPSGTVLKRIDKAGSTGTKDERGVAWYGVSYREMRGYVSSRNSKLGKS